MAEGFLGRWAQRKTDARQGKPLVEPEAPPALVPEPPTQAQTLRTATAPAPSPVVAADASSQPSTGAPAGAAPLTLQDAQALDPNSDFKPFIARSVDPTVRNAAMKKLFTDPHFNVMDGLDTYIDDYSLPDPLPDAMLRQMVSAQFLNLVDPEPESPQTTGPAADPIANPPPAPDAAPGVAPTNTRQDDHAHPDLRLQPNHAPASPDAGHGTA